MATAKENASGIATTVRVPEPFLEKVKALSAEIGDSQNGVMLHLMFMGMKVYEGTVQINLDAHRSTR